MTASLSETEQSDIVPYEGAGAGQYSDYSSTGGRKRGKRNSRKRSRKHMNHSSVFTREKGFICNKII